ncbi:MAG TPA: cation-transporting P-type ATPase [Egicoccus sp.]|nr:cation-transporting P-type ATPase [Egicoccus sp.]HSK23185.1 cation-transporting P-type ATPase [Egicoccus sp.]
MATLTAAAAHEPLPLAVEFATATPAQVFAAYATSPEGLDADEASRRLVQHGANELTSTGQTPLWRVFAGNVGHLMAILLWVGGGIALLAHLPQLAVAVWCVNLINGVFSTWQEHRAERAIDALRQLLPAKARVLRNGLVVEELAARLVPGDVLLLAEGDRIPADGRLVEAFELRVDQSALTGESRPVRRSAAPWPDADGPSADQINRVFAGTNVTGGRGKAVVIATGMQTEFGTIAALTQRTRGEPSPLQRELATLSRVVGAIAVGMGLLFFGLAQAFTDLPLARGLVFALGMIVAFVPEGLLPTVTLALARATQRMADRHALVRRLSAVETLGCATVICSDKTGTLTANQMTVRMVATAGRAWTVTGTGYDPDGHLEREAGRAVDVPAEVAELARAAALVNDARLLPPDGTNGWAALGDPTEAALLVLAAKCGFDVDAERRRTPRVGEAPFDSARKRMSTVHDDGGRRLLCCKGAPNELLPRCANARVDGAVVPLDEVARQAIEHDNDAMARQAMRVLLVAERVLDPADAERPVADLEQELTFLGLVGMLDPPRPAVAAAVTTCQRAGIRLIMITGDYGVTAESIARRIGIAGPDDELTIVNGTELDGFDDDALRQVVAAPVVFARATPEQKLRIVRALQANGEVVAVTGDGVNDAPALKQADIGIAMGVAGTDVAREAADLVLLDDDFSSIVAAVEEGRAVYDNVRKFTGYIFTSNTPEAVPFVLFGLSAGRIPIALDVMHILAIDLGTDLVPALALGAEPPEPGVMDRPPRSRNEHLVTPALLRRSYLWLGPVQAAIVMAAFFLAFGAQGVTGAGGYPSSGPVHAAAAAAALAAVVTTQIGNLFAHRNQRASGLRPWRPPHRLMWIGIASELLLIIGIVYLPPLQRVVGTAAFPAWLWLPLLAVAPALLFVDELRKILVRRHHHEEVRR